MLTGSLQMPPGFMFDFSGIFIIFFVVVVLIIIIGIAAASSSRRRVQRPLTEDTDFPPPPPPDTVLVKCQYCGTSQTWRENCMHCGAPLPRPVIT